MSEIDLNAPGTCYTCAFSPRWRGRFSAPGCAVLTGGDEGVDMDIIKYCEDSGCNDEGSDRWGWPLDTGIICPAWVAR